MLLGAFVFMNQQTKEHVQLFSDGICSVSISLVLVIFQISFHCWDCRFEGIKIGFHTCNLPEPHDPLVCVCFPSPLLVTFRIIFFYLFTAVPVVNFLKLL